MKKKGLKLTKGKTNMSVEKLYGNVKANMPQIRTSFRDQAMLIELIMMAYDDMMKKIYDDINFSAKDVVKFFDREGNRWQRGRSHTI